MSEVHLTKHARGIIIGFLCILVFSIAGLGTYAALHKKKLSPSQLQLQSFFDAPAINRTSLVGSTGTWSLKTSLNALQLNWTSNTQTFTVWDSFNGVCGPNSVSYAKLSNSTWFDPDTYVPFGLGFPSSYSVLATTNLFSDPITAQSYAFKLVLYPGMLRIEQDGPNPGFWNNYQGISGALPIPSLVWPSIQDNGDQVLWKIGDVINSAQFRSNGKFLVGSGIDPFNNPNGFSSWFAEEHTLKLC
jgi:hypothetical protein